MCARWPITKYIHAFSARFRYKFVTNVMNKNDNVQCSGIWLEDIYGPIDDNVYCYFLLSKSSQVKMFIQALSGHQVVSECLIALRPNAKSVSAIRTLEDHKTANYMSTGSPLINADPCGPGATGWVEETPSRWQYVPRPSLFWWWRVQKGVADVGHLA